MEFDMSAPDAISAALTVDPTAIVDETPTVAPKSKRTCNTWTNRESTVFFEAAVVVGRRSACQPSCTAPEKRHGNRDTSAMIAAHLTFCSQHGREWSKIGDKLEAKTRDQIRHYYYRSLRKIRALLDRGTSATS